jgi:hypothetical protein
VRPFTPKTLSADKRFEGSFAATILTVGRTTCCERDQPITGNILPSIDGYHIEIMGSS